MKLQTLVSGTLELLNNNIFLVRDIVSTYGAQDFVYRVSHNYPLPPLTFQQPRVATKCAWAHVVRVISSTF